MQRALLIICFLYSVVNSLLYYPSRAHIMFFEVRRRKAGDLYDIPCMRGMAAPGAGTIVLSDISCVSASLNAVPDKCGIYLDRRLRPGETTEQARRELDSLIEGISGAAWEPGTLRRKSWTGTELVYEPCHDPWKISPDHPLTAACRSAFSDVFGAEPDKYGFWDFGTNAVAPIGMGVPCIGFGPGDSKLAHMRNERCRPEQVTAACGFYAALTKRL